MTPDPAGVPTAGGGPSPQTPSAGGSLSSAELEAIARANGLRRVGHRPPLGEYLRDLWSRRQFLWTLSTAQAYAKTQESRLGQVWAVLNPVMLAGAYFLIFGLLLDTRGGTQNFVGFLTAGIFTFVFLSTVMSQGARAVTGSMQLVRSLSFPRVLLPISKVTTELIAAVPTFAVLLVIMLATGERPDAEWLLFPVALLLIASMSLGIGMVFARLVHDSRDAANLIPLVIRLLRYVSGVFYSVDHYLGAAGAPHWLAVVMTYQPVAVMMTLVRESLLGETAVDPVTWLAGLFWAVVLPLGGLIWFWRGEGTYGRG
ncbi:ABC transporter permease [Kytococcus sp. HMSC28H12]|nr:ABC transporter permease [Kytococcus sp. HMSC28H12]OFS15056.1 phosphate ABC transporter permease [Kytococcus sp. HMSC28H12]